MTHTVWMEENKLNIAQILVEMTQPSLRNFRKEEIMYWISLAWSRQKPVCVPFLGSTSEALGLNLEIEFEVTKVVFGPDYMKVITRGPISPAEIQIFSSKFEVLGIQVFHGWDEEEKEITVCT